ncbi:MAG: type II CRISPR RNA-guided endonuclease Cas9 [Bacteroidetes bacterium]|nr:type II CRISPR RNA-guided endonuclease Cas9 [Bacteroidota bacterium]
MKKILGLDLGTNSIGWSLIEQDFENKQGKILGMGSRIIPMSQEILGEFGKGNSVSQTSARTDYRSKRRLNERNHLRRERLHRVLNVLEFLPEHYASDIDFEKRFGKFKDETETKLVWKKNGQKENGKAKFDFVFLSSFTEMIEEFKKFQPDLLNRKNRKGDTTKIPYDWTIYYLRKKALTQIITKQELAWLILNFNQKRGYYQLRGEEEESNNNINEYVIPLKITKVEKGEVDKKNDRKTWYAFTLSNGWVYSATFTAEPKWLDTEKDFLVTEELDENRNIKIVKDKKTDRIGKEKRKITPLPSFDEINLMSKKDQDKIYKKIKARTEVTIENSKQTVGSYIFESLLKNPTQKIRGKLVRTIERKYYKDELKAILQKQIELQPKLFTDELYSACVRELYRSNEAHQQQLSKRDFVHLFLEDIIFYQRPLRSQKSSIGNCSLEFRAYKRKDENGKETEVKEYLKVIPKSNPYYQEFRVWQWLYNLKIYLKADDSDVTAIFLKSTEDWEKLFEFLMSKKEVDHKDILKYIFKDLKGKAQTAEIAKYRWNYVYDSEKDESKTYPMNETGYEIRKQLQKVDYVPADFLKIIDTKQVQYKKKNELGIRVKTGREGIESLGTREYQLWHIIYSVTDRKEYEEALKKFAKKYGLNENAFAENLGKVWFKPDYGSFSEKAIKKLLPLMRLGKYWNWENIDTKTQARIDKLLTGEFDSEIQNRVREQAINLTEKNHFQGLQLWLASYIVYDRHSEANITGKWNSVEDLKAYLNEFKQHSLRNPIVEQVITETLRVVKDIWEKYGNGAKDFFDEIHIELGREMKNTADERKRLTTTVTENENTNQRIKLLLMELKNDSKIENVREYSPSQQEILKIYEDGILNSIKSKEYKEGEKNQKEEDEAMLKISTSPQPTKLELIRYKLWLEQKYRSPYTGETIPLSKLFTTAYEIEHIIPQSRYFDDSLSNKVICEAEVNKKKDNQLGLEFIKKHPGEKIQIGNKHVTIFTEDAYKTFIEEYYSKNKAKRNKLLLEEIPEKMIARQLNDTRYISKFVSQILSNLVREDKNDEGVNSKNIIPGNGKITDRLKQDWGLNDIWNELILPRFERMNELTKTTVFTAKNKEGHIIPAIPLELSKGFQKKRIDHRHHAIDALVIACATRDHLNLLNNQSAKSDNSRFDLQNKLRNKEKWKDNKGKEHDKFTEFKKPWQNFTVDAKNELDKIVVTFKQNLRVINKTTNTYEKYENGKKIELKQEGLNWAIRKSIHKETISGKVDLPRIRIPKGKILTATRKNIDTNFDLKTIESITDTGIQKILRNYLASKNNNPEVAFSPEGIEDLNKNIADFNNGKLHQPIYKARIFELGNKFPLGIKGNKKYKYVEAAKGTNLFFAIYQDENGKRNFETIPLNIVIERQKQGLISVPEINEKGDSLLFYLSPNDLVYIPTQEEISSKSKIDFENLVSEQKNRIYKFTDSSDTTANFVPFRVANLLFNISKKEQEKRKIDYSIQNEFGVGSPQSKSQNSTDGIMIKNYCIKIKADRLGNISKA